MCANDNDNKEYDFMLLLIKNSLLHKFLRVKKEGLKFKCNIIMSSKKCVWVQFAINFYYHPI
jgi:hypothetical protein